MHGERDWCRLGRRRTGAGRRTDLFGRRDPWISALIQEQGTWQDRALFWNLTDRLIYRNAQTGEFEPWIAESWTVSDDGLRYDFVIRQGVTYSDGTPLDVESVKRT